MKLFTVSLTVTLALLSSIGMAGRTVSTPGSLFQVPDSLGGDRMDTLSNSSLVAKSAGKGYRSPHVLAENVSVLSSGKTFIARERLG